MKLKAAVILFWTVLILTVNAQTPSWQWAKAAGGNFSDGGTAVAADSAGNAIVTGFFGSQNITFNNYVLTNPCPLPNGGAPPTTNIFIAKYDANGNVIWANNVGGVGSDYGNDVVIGLGGNIYATGNFNGPISLGNATFTAASGFFIGGYNASGNLLWAKSAGSNTDHTAQDMCIDKSGNLLVTGYFLGQNILFDTVNITCPPTATNAEYAFITKYDQAGNVLWAKGIGRAIPQAVCSDASNNILVTGYFYTPSLALGNTTITNTGGSNTTECFIAKYDAAGNLLWAKSGAGLSSDYGNSLNTDATGNIWLVGHSLSSSLTLGATTLTAGNAHMFIAKYDAAGNVLWAQNSDMTNGVKSQVRLRSNGNAYISGYATGNSVFGIPGGIGGFIGEFDATGNILWAKQGNSNNDIRGICMDVNENIYATGLFLYSSVFDNTVLTQGSANYPYSPDFFVAKLGSGVTGVKEESLGAISVFPNPFNMQITVQTDTPFTNATLSIYNALGQQVAECRNISGLSVTVPRGGLLPGIYFLKLVQNGRILADKKLIAID